jgi:hypothetical protein
LLSLFFYSTRDSGNLKVGNVLEGEHVSIKCNSLSGKLLNGSNITVLSGEKVDLNGIYGTNTTLRVKDSLALQVFKGKLIASVSEGDCKVHGIDGSFEIGCLKGDVHVQVNSLSSNSVSKVVTDLGNIQCLLDPEVRTKLTCSTPTSSSKNPILVESDAFIKSSNSSIPPDVNIHSFSYRFCFCCLIRSFILFER